MSDIDHPGGLRHPDGAAEVAWTRKNGAVPHRPWTRRAPRRLGGALAAAVAVAAPALAQAPASAQPPAAVWQPAPSQYAQEQDATSPEHRPVRPAARPMVEARAQQALPRPHEQLVPLGAEEAWRYSTGAGVTVAVLDSGVDADHPDLAGRVLPGKDYVDGSTDGRVDVVGHGTTVASLIAGRGEETAVGLAPDATILPIRVLDDRNRYQSATTVAEGVVWAVRQGAQVINLSLGGEHHSAALREAVEIAMANDVVVVACTGNINDENDTQVWYPAREPGVVAVAGVVWSERDPIGWPASLTGPETVLAAPSVVTGAQAGGGHRAVQGTSFSSALVAATAALIRARWPEMSAANVVNRLVVTAEDYGPAGRDPVFGFGVVDPVAALTESVPPVPINPLDTRPWGGTAGLGPAPDSPAPAALATPTPTASGPPGGQPAGGAADGTADPPGRDGPPLALVWGVLAGLALLCVVVAVTASRLARRPG